MIQEFLWLFFLFWVVWIIGAVGHELFHGLACYLQGAKFKISIWFHEITIGKRKFKIPSMQCSPEGDMKNNDLFYYLGGVGLGGFFILLSVLVFFFSQPLFIVLFLIGCAHFFYGLYEGMFIGKLDLETYMIWHYLVYVIGIAIGALVIRGRIYEYIFG